MNTLASLLIIGLLFVAAAVLSKPDYQNQRDPQDDETDN